MSQKKIGPHGGLKKLPTVLAAVSLIALIAVIALQVYASRSSDIFTQVEYGSGLQNSQVITLEDQDLTVLGTYRNEVLAFDANGQQVWNFPTTGSISAMQYVETDGLLLVGSQDRNIYALNAATGELQFQLAINGRIYDIDYHPDTRQIAAVGSAGASKATLAVFDLDTQEKVLQLSYKTIGQAVQFSPDGQYVYYGNNRASLMKIHIQSGETVAETRLQDCIVRMDVARGAGTLALITEDGYFYRLDPDLNELQKTRFTGEGWTVGVTENADWYGVGMREGDVYILDANGVQNFYQRLKAQVSQIYIGEEESYVVTLSEELYRFDTKKLSVTRTLQSITKYGVWVIAALVLLTAALVIVALEKPRYYVGRYLASLYRSRTAYLMLLPTFALILVFNYYPVFQAFYYAFTDWSSATRTMREVNFIGFDNFVKMVNDGYFLLGVKNMLLIMVTSFLKLFTVPILLANLVYMMTSSRRRYWYRLLLVVPMVVPGIVSTLMWGNIYDPNVGALNNFLGSVGLEHLQRSWLGQESTALWSIIFMGFPWVNSMAFLVFYGGMLDIPAELFEAAKVDGSNRTWDFFHIKLPLISPQLKMMFILTFIGSMQDYGSILILTNGGPGVSTYVPGLELYMNASAFGQYGYACALGVVLFIFIMIGTLFNLRAKTQDGIQ